MITGPRLSAVAFLAVLLPWTLPAAGQGARYPGYSEANYREFLEQGPPGPKSGGGDLVADFRWSFENTENWNTTIIEDRYPVTVHLLGLWLFKRQYRNLHVGLW